MPLSKMLHVKAPPPLSLRRPQPANIGECSRKNRWMAIGQVEPHKGCWCSGAAEPASLKRDTSLPHFSGVGHTRLTPTRFSATCLLISRHWAGFAPGWWIQICKPEGFAYFTFPQIYLCSGAKRGHPHPETVRTWIMWTAWLSEGRKRWKPLLPFL